MKSHIAVSGTTRKATDGPSRHSFVGKSAAQLAPPNYGISFVDNATETTATVQRMGDPEEDDQALIQSERDAVLRESSPEEEEEPIQGMFEASAADPVVAPVAPESNRTGMPNELRAAIESLSGFDLSDVRVHANSAKPAHINALAYTQGNNIHLAPGQERHLPHEAWHVVQQKQGRVQPTRQLKGLGINDQASFEGEADRMGARAARIAAADGLPGRSGEKPGLNRSRGADDVIQRAIGMEIEIPVPADQLSAADVTYIRGQAAAAAAAGPPVAPLGGGVTVDPAAANKQNAKQRRDANGRIDYGVQIRAPAGGFRVEADHDDRVMTRPWNNPPGWPLPEGGVDTILEIVMDPPAETLVQFNTAMANIATFVNQVMVGTNNLTTHWANAYIAGLNIGPLDYPGVVPAVRQRHHNFQGSVQVNVGIDLREYHSLLKWYANSAAARPRRAPAGHRLMYTDIRTHMRTAVNIGRTITRDIYRGRTRVQRRAMGNLRGLRGWITHLALYILRGTIAGGVGGTSKNLAPALLKSPATIAAQYGMTASERNYFTGHRPAIMDQIFAATGRVADVGQALNTVDTFASLGPGHASQIDVGTLSSLTTAVPALAGTPIPNPTGVGLARAGSPAVAALPSVPVAPGNVGGGAGTRGGVVVEFRTLPGYYDGAAAWRALGLRFFRAAASRNRRSGIAP